MSGDFAAIVRAFGLTIPPNVMADAAVLAYSIECVDRHLDPIPDTDAREEFSSRVLRRLRQRADSAPELPDEVCAWLDRLSELVERRHAGAKFGRLVDAILTHSEAMRSARRGSDYVRHAGDEGRLMVEMLLVVLDSHATAEFASFMRRLAVPAEMVDKFRDARRDFDAGELRIKPGFLFRLRLLWIVLRELPPLAARCLAHRGLAAWGARSLWIELRAAACAVTR